MPNHNILASICEYCRAIADFEEKVALQIREFFPITNYETIVEKLCPFCGRKFRSDRIWHYHLIQHCNNNQRMKSGRFIVNLEKM